MTPRYQEFAVDAALAPHVHCVWSFEASEDGDEQAIPPDGRAELIVHRGAAYEERGDDGRWRAQPMLLFAGQLTRPLVLRSRGAVAVLAMRFTPAGAWAFAGRAMARCNDRRIRDCRGSARISHHIIDEGYRSYELNQPTAFTKNETKSLHQL